MGGWYAGGAGSIAPRVNFNPLIVPRRRWIVVARVAFFELVGGAVQAAIGRAVAGRARSASRQGVVGIAVQHDGGVVARRFANSSVLANIGFDVKGIEPAVQRLDNTHIGCAATVVCVGCAEVAAQ